jgi:mycothiol synthase
MTSLGRSQHITHRTASSEADFWRVRQFLLDAWAVSPLGAVWDVRRWDGAYFHRTASGWDAHWHGGAAVGIWEEQPDSSVRNAAHADAPLSAEPRIVAVVHPEGQGEAWLEVLPAYRWLEPQLLDWAEVNLASATDRRTGAAVRPRLLVFAGDADALRLELLNAHGYMRTKGGEHIRRWLPPAPPEPQPLPAGYRLHTLRPEDHGDCARYAALLNAAFRRTIHSAEEVANFARHSPSFDPQLELIAQAPDGSFAALTGMIHDAQNGYALFEPVCATPNPRPLGLTGLLMHEGVRRAVALGAREVYVGSGYGMAANRFYTAAGFRVVHSGSYWAKEL